MGMLAFPGVVNPRPYFCVFEVVILSLVTAPQNAIIFPNNFKPSPDIFPLISNF